MKWKIVPVEATGPMAENMLGEMPFTAYGRALAAAPRYVVTDEDVEAAHAAYTKVYWSRDQTRTVIDCMRAALEAFVRRLEGGGE